MKHVTQPKAEERYLAWLASDERPDWVNPLVMEEIPVTKPPRDETPVTKVGRPKKYTSDAERQAAYRGRK